MSVTGLYSSQGGFTLLEVLIVLVILGVISAAAITGLSSLAARSEQSKRLAAFGRLVDTARRRAQESGKPQTLIVDESGFTLLPGGETKAVLPFDQIQIDIASAWRCRCQVFFPNGRRIGPRMLLVADGRAHPLIEASH